MKAPSFQITDHANLRRNQRGISNFEIQSIVETGTCIRKQGMRFYFGGKKVASKLHSKGLADSTKNLVVVMAGEEDVVITCYKNGNGLRHIKKKSKRLC